MRYKALPFFRLCLAVFTVLGVNLFALQLDEPGAAAGASSASEVIDLVNQLRSANGLAPYKIDSALMAAAQGHSEYMAESGTASHTGAGGSTPAGRAAAAGYSGSGVTENIMTGSNLSAAQAVGWWQSDGLHLSTLLSTSATDVGAGVASSGDTIYYALVIGSKGSGSGSGGATGQQQATASGGAAAPSTPPTPEVIVAVEALTPGPDGSILHVVQQGQTMWDIAVAYKMTLADLYAMNGLTAESVIFPGERIIIRLPDKTPSAASPASGAVASSGTSGAPVLGTSEPGALPATSTLRPVTRTPIPPTRETSTQTSPPVSGTPSADSSQPILAAPILAASELPGAAGKSLDPVLVIIGALAVIGASLVLVGSVLKRGR